jgi:AcrR family transcriptional regulator
MVRVVKKPEERRKDIITLATKLFWENDYEKTSMNQIVSELGIAKGTVYHYFKSKEELMFAVIDDEVVNYIKMMKRALKKAPVDAVDRFIYLLRKGVVADRSKSEHLHKSGNNVLHTRLLAKLISELALIYADVIKDGCDQGVFKCQRPLETAEFLLSPAFIVDVGVYPWSEETLKRRQSAFPAIIETQLGTKKGAFKALSFRG